MKFANADEFALHMRREIIKMLAASGSGHPGGSLRNGYHRRAVP